MLSLLLKGSLRVTRRATAGVYGFWGTSQYTYFGIAIGIGARGKLKCSWCTHLTLSLFLSLYTLYLCMFYIYIYISYINTSFSTKDNMTYGLDDIPVERLI